MAVMAPGSTPTGMDAYEKAEVNPEKGKNTLADDV